MAANAVFKDLLVIKKGDHNGSWYTGGQEYLSKIESFIKKCIVQYELPSTNEWITGKHSDFTHDL